MDLSRVHKTPIIVEHVTQDAAVDNSGDPTETTTWTRYLGWYWQDSATEQTGNTQIGTERHRCTLDRAAAGHVDEGDRLYIDGELDTDGNYVVGSGEAYDVDGPPWSATNPRTRLVEYVLVRLARSR